MPAYASGAAAGTTVVAMADHAPGAGAHLVSLIRTTVPPIHPGGRPLLLASAAGTLVARIGLRALGLKSAARAVTTVGTLATVGGAAFFRAPRRVPPVDPELVVAPADGVVSLIDEAAPPPELDLDPAPRPRVSIFLSIFDVHVQRIPIDGSITHVAYRPGTFVSADLDKASDDNERNSVVLEPAVGGQVIVTQIAGLVARRIVCDAIAGSAVAVGDTYGLIRYGSRVDTYLPPGTPITVRTGQRTIGGETVLATLRLGDI